MSSWSEGYVSEINYTAGYYTHLNPQQLIVPFLMAGVQPPKVINACELGFGLGVSLNVHAAAGHAKWYATDFNPSQALHAQSLADSADPSKVLIADQSFAEFCRRDDLPMFDYIGLHGIWSWISTENRKIIVDFLARKLKVGGVLYISYNTLPGWSPKAPLRHLFLQNYQRLSSSDNSIEYNVKKALKQTQVVLNNSNGLSKHAPLIKNAVADLDNASVNYLAHEYLNQDWQPMYFSQIEDYLKQAKLSYVCSSSFLDDYAEVLFNQEQKEQLAQIDDKSLQQTMKDFFLNKQFRRDYWVKGKMSLDSHQVEKEWRQQSVLLIKPIHRIDKRIERYHAVDFKDELFHPVVQALSGDKICRVDDLCQQFDGRIAVNQIFEILAILIDRGEAVLVQPQAVIDAQKPITDKLNQAVIGRVLTAGQVDCLASPVFGGGISYHNVDMLFFSAYLQGLEQDQWEHYVWSRLRAYNLFLTKNGEIIKGDDENLAELTRLKEIFVKETLPIAMVLQIV